MFLLHRVRTSSAGSGRSLSAALTVSAAAAVALALQSSAGAASASQVAWAAASAAAPAPSAAVWAVPGEPAVVDPSVPVPALPAGLPARVEDPAPYVKQSSCDPVAKPGAVALGDLLRATYPGTSYGIARACGADGFASEHYEGRAVDWMVSVRDPIGQARAYAFLTWLLAPDAAGVPFANARRLGVMYVIWDDHIWGSYAADRGWRPYSTCASTPATGSDTACHRDHVHLSLSWAGAMKRTSWWTGEVAATDYGPCRPSDLNWAAPRTTATSSPCPSYPAVTAPAGAPTTTVAIARYSGAVVGPGFTGPVVKAVQTALGVTADGSFGPVTGGAVSAFRSAHGLPAGQVVDGATWRALLAAAPTTTPTPSATGTTPSPSGSSGSSGSSGESGSGASPAPGAAAPGTTAARPVLRYGSTGAAVTALQVALGVRPVSGWFGPVTQQAVQAFQKANRLPVTGVVDVATWRALGR